MKPIGQMLGAILARITARRNRRHSPELPAAVAAEHLRLLLSCGF